MTTFLDCQVQGLSCLQTPERLLTVTRLARLEQFVAKIR
jgi:hypothetical protein